MLGRVTGDDALALVAQAAQEIYGLSGRSPSSPGNATSTLESATMW